MAASSFLQNLIMRVPCTSQETNVIDNKSSTNVLIPHNFDRPSRCILEPEEVVRMMKYQGEELIRQEKEEPENGLETAPPMEVSMDSAPQNEDTWDDVQSSLFGTEFSFGANNTTVTTATAVTPVLSNHDKSLLKANYLRSKAEQFRILEATQQEPTMLPIIDAQSLSTKLKDMLNKADGRLKKELPHALKLSGLACVPLGSQFQHDELASLRALYGRALHLKVKANVGNYFWGKFMEQFPYSPIPEPLELTRAAAIPGLGRSFTENSNVMPPPSYGDLVHSDPVTMMVDESEFMDLGITGSLGLVKRFEVATSGDRLKSPNHYKILLNRRSGVPLAVCALKSTRGPPVVRIYTVKQRVPGQHPAATTTKLGLSWCESFPLYAWAEFTAEGDFPLPVRYNLFMSAGSAGRFEVEPSYRASHRTPGSPEIAVVGRTESEVDLTGCALISLQSKDDAADDYFSVSVAHGIDPALMICLAAIVDETMEHAMKKMCNVVLKSKVKPPLSRTKPPSTEHNLSPSKQVQPMVAGNRNVSPLANRLSTSGVTNRHQPVDQPLTAGLRKNSPASVRPPTRTYPKISPNANQPRVSGIRDGPPLASRSQSARVPTGPPRRTPKGRVRSDSPPLHHFASPRSASAFENEVGFARGSSPPANRLGYTGAGLPQAKLGTRVYPPLQNRLRSTESPGKRLFPVGRFDHLD